jgi:iron complex outermembrane recepter protein
MVSSRWMNSAAALAVLAALAPQAFAQSTGTEEVEKVVVTGSRAATGGLIVKEKATKTRSTIDQKYIETQTAGQSVAQILNLLPGYNFTNNDAYGSSGGNVRMRGFDGPRISLTQDGIPLNDSGNYAIFTNQLIDPEYLSRATLNTGTTDVDSPTASATGGTINTTTRKPFETLTLTAGASFGSDQYERYIGIVDLGEYDGVSAYAGFSAQRYDKFKGPGEQKKYQANARIYQKIGEDSFISIIGHYNENRNNNYRQITLAQFNDPAQRNIDFFETCTRDAPTNGVIDNENAGSATNIADTASCANFFGSRINPSNTGNVRLQGNFRLTDDLRLTVDPSWQYVKATGGQNSFTFREDDTRLRGGGVPPAGIDLNGDGDIIDTGIRLNSTNLTNTSRFGVTTSLIWELDTNQRLRAAYTGDFARHRQTAAAGRLFADGHVRDVWAGLDDVNNRIFAPDGSFLRNRDRLSNADLNQVAFSYSGLFLDETLRVDLGLRAPFFTRDLDQRCFTQMNSQTVRCTTQAWTDVDGDGIGAFANTAGLTGVNEWFRPYTTTFKYDKVLPNLGISYEFAENHTLYASYAAGLSAPRTDNLYFVFGNELTGVVRFPGVAPEETQAFDLGYRFQGSWATVSLALWQNTFDNYIIRSFDQDLGSTVDRNIGAVELQGFDFEVGVRPVADLMVYASASYNSSEVQEDVAFGTTGGLGFLPTKGKTLAETPEWTYAGRVEYTIENITLAVQGKYVGDRFATDVNDQVSPSYTVFDANAVVDLTDWGLADTELQINGINIFDEEYLGSISSQTNAVTILDSNPGLAGNQTINAGTPNYNLGAPQTFQLQIRTKF